MASNGGVKQPAAAKAVKKAVKSKAMKEKKTKTAKIASHPPYFQMIKEALLALKERSGSSPYAIAKYMEEKHKAALPENFRKMLANQLKKSAVNGKLTKVKASFKLSDSGKKETAPAAAVGKAKKATAVVKKPLVTKSKKPAASAPKATATTAKPKTSVKVAKKPAKAVTVKKAAPAKKAKKMTPAKAKQPKSVKSPAAKRSRKATA